MSNRFQYFLPVLAVTAGFFSAPASAGFLATVEATGVQNTTSTFSYSGIETFDTSTNGVQVLTTDFGTSGATTGVYTNANIANAGSFGGAGGVGKYITADQFSGPDSYTLQLAGTGVNYFGLWFSAASAGNTIDFFSGGSLLHTFTLGEMISRIDGSYYSNPNNGQDPGEPFAFVNFYNTSGSFEKIVFHSNGNGLESDNHTLGVYSTTSGTIISAVPEPSVMVMLSVGAGLVGWTARRRKTKPRAA